MDTLLDNFTIDGYELQRADHLKTKGREETRTQNSENDLFNPKYYILYLLEQIYKVN